MAFSVQNSGATVTPSKLTVNQGGADRLIRRFSVQDGGSLRVIKEFTDALTGTASPATVIGTAFTASEATITTPSTEVTPEGGIAPYTYAWTQISLSGGATPTITAPTFATTTFIQAGVAANISNTAVFRCTITDNFGQTATIDVGATFYNFGSII